MMRQSGAETLVTEEPYAFMAHVRVCGGAGCVTTGSTRKPTPNSLRSSLAVRRASGMEECGNTLGVQAPNEPLGLSVIDHSMT